VSSKNNSPTIRFRDTEHQTWFFDKCRGFSLSACGFSVLHIVLFRFKWNHASSVKKQIVCYLNPFVCKPHVLDYRITVELGAKKRRWTLLNELTNVGSVYRGGEEELVSYMFVSVFTVLKHFLFWVVSYTVYSIHVPRAFCPHHVYR
jgi:hypothetical protein